MTNQEATAAVELAACPDSARVSARVACCYDTLELAELAGDAPGSGMVLEPDAPWIDED